MEKGSKEDTDSVILTIGIPQIQQQKLKVVKYSEPKSNVLFFNFNKIFTPSLEPYSSNK